MTNNVNTQEAFAIVRELGALVATSGVSADNVTKANSIINDLLTKVVQPAVQKLTASGAGLLV